MKRHLIGFAAFVFATSSMACAYEAPTTEGAAEELTSSSDAPVAPAAVDEGHPAWLVGTLTSTVHADDGSWTTTILQLGADGAGKRTTRIHRRGLVSGYESPVWWSATDRTLSVALTDYAIRVSPRCDSVLLDETTFTLSPDDPGACARANDVARITDHVAKK